MGLRCSLPPRQLTSPRLVQRPRRDGDLKRRARRGHRARERAAHQGTWHPAPHQRQRAALAQLGMPPRSPGASQKADQEHADAATGPGERLSTKAQRAGDIRARVDRPQPEHPRGGLIELAVGQFERRRDRGAPCLLPSLYRSAASRSFPAVGPPGCDCGFRNQQERHDYAAPALLDDFELTI
jgi:hypothetical protein